MAHKTKICLLTGYLGAGKTTILNHILGNEQGIRAAVLVNDIGEINVDAELIAKGGFSQVDGELIPMTNGCLCCTLSEDLSRQLNSLAKTGSFDYIVIEASGVCEPIPIAYTISAFCKDSQFGGTAPLELDNIVAVVDCARMWDEFDGGKDLLASDVEDDDIENLLIQQIEFCSTLVLNKCDTVSRAQIDELKAIVRSLQKDAVIVEAVQGQAPLDELVDTGRFDFDRVYDSAGWLAALEQGTDEGAHGEKDGHVGHGHDHEGHGHGHEGDGHGHDHGHDHGHHHHHHGDDTLEYGISTFVYERRRPFDVDRFSDFVTTWPREVIRAKGQLWAAQDPDMCFLFEQAGRRTTLSEQGFFMDSAPDAIKKQYLEANPEAARDWDPKLGDRMTKICVIGRNMNKEALVKGLDACLTDWTPEDWE